jgi:hypothetical protein
MREMIRPIFMKMIVGQQEPIVTPELSKVCSTPGGEEWEEPNCICRICEGLSQRQITAPKLIHGQQIDY